MSLRKQSFRGICLRKHTRTPGRTLLTPKNSMCWSFRSNYDFDVLLCRQIHSSTMFEPSFVDCLRSISRFFAVCDWFPFLSSSIMGSHLSSSFPFLSETMGENYSWVVIINATSSKEWFYPIVSAVSAAPHCFVGSRGWCWGLLFSIGNQHSGFSSYRGTPSHPMLTIFGNKPCISWVPYLEKHTHEPCSNCIASYQTFLTTRPQIGRHLLMVTAELAAEGGVNHEPLWT